MKRIALAIAALAMAGCSKGEQKPAETPQMMMTPETSKMMMMPESSHMMMMPDSAKKMKAAGKEKL